MRTAPRTLILSLILLLVLPSLSKAQAPEQADVAQIGPYLARLESERGFSAAVLIVHQGEVVLRQGYGLADPEARLRFTPGTAVGIASLSKQFAAAAILRLADQGPLSVDDQLGDLLPGVPIDKAQITLHHLLTHTSGLPSDHFESDLEPLTRDQALERIYAARLLSQPGQRFNYSNAGYTLLAAVVEHISGQAYLGFLDQEFFQPLGMTVTGGWSAGNVAALPAASGSMNGSSSGPVTALPGPYWTVMGNGEIVSTVDDMLRWYQALYGGEVLSPASTEAMFTAYSTDGGSPVNYGYGWEVSSSDDLGRLITHNGGGITGNSILSHYVDQDLIIIILGNRIDYRTLGPLPAYIDLPADEASQAIAANLTSGDFSRLPGPTFVLWPYATAVLGVAAAVIYAGWRWLQRRSHKRKASS